MNDDVAVRDLVIRLSVSNQTLYRHMRNLSIRPEAKPGQGRAKFVSEADAQRILKSLDGKRPRTGWDQIVQWLEELGLTPRTVTSASEISNGRYVATAEVVNWLRNFADAGLRKELNPDATELFGLQQAPISLKAGAESFDYGLGRFFPDNLKAAAEASAMLGFLREYMDGRLLVRHHLPLRFRSNVLSWGGPLSNSILRIIYNAKRIGGEQFYSESPLLRLPFRWVIDDATRTEFGVPSKSVTYWTHGADGHVMQRINRPNTLLIRTGPNIDDNRRYEPVVDQRGGIEADYLLVSRLPNVLAYGDEEHFALTTFSGTHGIGTRASTLLLSTNPSAADIITTVKERLTAYRCSWFQFLVKVHLIQGDEGHPHEPSRLEPADQDDGWFIPITIESDDISSARDRLINLRVVYKG